jgi:hypothetical protein
MKQNNGFCTEHKQLKRKVKRALERLWKLTWEQRERNVSAPPKYLQNVGGGGRKSSELDSMSSTAHSQLKVWMTMCCCCCYYYYYYYYYLIS